MLNASRMLRSVMTKLPDKFSIINHTTNTLTKFDQKQIICQEAMNPSNIKPFYHILLPCGYPESVKNSNTLTRLLDVYEAYYHYQLLHFNAVFSLYSIYVHCIGSVSPLLGNKMYQLKLNLQHYHGYSRMALDSLGEYYSLINMEAFLIAK